MFIIPKTFRYKCGKTMCNVCNKLCETGGLCFMLVAKPMEELKKYAKFLYYDFKTR